MIGLDTNALVRDIMQDDPQPSSKATRLGESLTSEAPGVVPLVAVVDLLRVPSSSHRLSRDQLVDTLDLLLRSKEILVDRAKLVLHAQRDFANGGNEFAGCLIERIAQAHGCQATMTLDAGAPNATGMTLVT
jgi:predicted nucleic-acid-binding protein